MDRAALRQVWRKRIDDLVRSGLSVRAWCERNGVTRNQTRYWQRQFAERDSDPDTSNGQWLPVEIIDHIPSPSRTSRLTVRIAGAAIDIEPGFDPVLLRSVVSALGSQPC